MPNAWKAHTLAYHCLRPDNFHIGCLEPATFLRIDPLAQHQIANVMRVCKNCLAKLHVTKTW